ncbi:DUF1993 family protein [Novosphingobium sp. TH158]|uniref:DUF1993 domain-containing protein n=1 Tax=Novosphingobium sp. TH158 TaxID=2067455 RepID=UPI000C79EFEE|nr:DUF1993 domain-containing protein [Novosphingobium sp. TH158]PLK26916.1 DUF1993 domain-containing protein [Novosphingobium sp. TH158]
MQLSLYQATVPSFLQILRPVAGLVEKAREHCKAQGGEEAALCDARLAPDMWPFAKQVMAAVQHSAGAIEGAKRGETGPDMSAPPTSFDALAAAVAGAIAALEKVTPEEVDGIAANDTCFRFGERIMPFTVEDYLLSFALPNFYFHASMAYAVLRNQGVQVGKADFLGAIRLKH